MRRLSLALIFSGEPGLIQRIPMRLRRAMRRGTGMSIGSTLSERATGARWFPILGLIFVATLINYLNRTVFGIARPLFVTELHIDPVWAGIIASAFSWSYAV